jgi:hypothetical protein
VGHEMLYHTDKSIGTTVIVSKRLKYVETIPGQHSMDLLQKTAILGT